MANNGKMYCTAANGGGLNYGSLVEFDIATNTLTLKDNFDNTTSGYNSYSELMQASNGKIYGTSYFGGANNLGVLFEFNISTGKIKGLAHFNGSNGSNPWGTLYEASNGKLYGISSQGTGGNYSTGVFYEYDAANTSLIAKTHFSRFDHGYGSQGEFIAGKNGKLYALSAGGDLGSRVLEYDIAKDSFFTRAKISGTCVGNLLQVNNLFGVGFDEINAENSFINLFPNPAASMITITASTNATELNIEIMNLEGKLMKQEKINNQGSVSLQGIPAGLYLVKINYNNHTETKKLIIH